MSIAGVACLLLVLYIAVGTHCRRIDQYISFPPYTALPEGTDEELYDSATLRRRFPEGVGAVQSIANLVLNVLDLQEVRVSPMNWVVSPLSLAAIFAQLLLGSRGSLQSVLTDSLSLEKGVQPTSRLEVHRQLGRLMKYLERSGNKNYILDLNAAVFLRPGVLLKPPYKHALLDFYNAQIYVVDFLRRSNESRKKINEWINESTHGKLKELYMYPLPLSTVSIMANVVYFNGRWETPFDPAFTKTGPFFISPDQKVDVPFMYGQKELLYRNTSNMQLIGIPYKNWEVVLYVLLPHDKLTTQLSVSQLGELISAAEMENVTLLMPKLKLFSTISVRDSVLKYLVKSKRHSTRTVLLRSQPISVRTANESSPHTGMPCTVGVRAPEMQQEDDDFDDVDQFNVGGASEDSRFRFNDVIHQVSLEIDEKGSEIAAVSSSLVDYSGDNLLLKINRPFWFFVRHEPSTAHLFWGRIVDPSNEGN